jgi:hypothetical protein
MRTFLFASIFTASLLHAADPATLFGKVMCGYQGWFATPTDGSNLGWVHYGFNKPGQCHIDLWPDVSELDADERFDTPLKLADGTTAQVYSSAHPKTVRRHFEWMREHQIDGVFFQRFGTVLKDKRFRAHHDTVLQHVRDSAKATGRTWSVMYDLSGMKSGELESVIMQDWKRLRTELRILDDPIYQRHVGKPVVAVWGIGFNDGRDYTLDESHALLRFLHDNPEFGKLTVMAGVPWNWRTQEGDATRDPKLHEVLQSADIISPWAVGRYHSPANAAQMISKVHEADAKWCREHNKDYLPVVFPGFSWSNLSKMRGVDAPLNAIPRLGGQFLWSQARERIAGGSSMLYIAMFDELDEGTAIFKTTSNVPVGVEGFVTEPTLPSDHYLWLTGTLGRALRKEIPLTLELPKR